MRKPTFKKWNLTRLIAIWCPL